MEFGKEPNDINKKLDDLQAVNEKRSLPISDFLWVYKGSNNRKKSEKEVIKIKIILNDMFDFLSEMPADKYHDYREFRNLRLRDYLINKFMRKKYAHEVK